MSGIPGMGQRRQAALKIRVIMIPLPENTAAGAASGVCYSGKGSCKVSGSLAGRSCIFRPYRGRGNEKPCGVVCCVYMQHDTRHGVWGYFVDKERFRYRFLEKGRLHTYFYSTRKGIRHPAGNSR